MLARGASEPVPFAPQEMARALSLLLCPLTISHLTLRDLRQGKRERETEGGRVHVYVCGCGAHIGLGFAPAASLRLRMRGRGEEVVAGGVCFV